MLEIIFNNAGYIIGPLAVLFIFLALRQEKLRIDKRLKKLEEHLGINKDTDKK